MKNKINPFLSMVGIIFLSIGIGCLNQIAGFIALGLLFFLIAFLQTKGIIQTFNECIELGTYVSEDDTCR